MRKLIHWINTKYKRAARLTLRLEEIERRRELEKFQNQELFIYFKKYSELGGNIHEATKPQDPSKEKRAV